MTIDKYRKIAIKKQFSCGRHYVYYKDRGCIEAFDIIDSSYGCIWKSVFYRYHGNRYREQLEKAIVDEATLFVEGDG